MLKRQACAFSLTVMQNDKKADTTSLLNGLLDLPVKKHYEEQPRARAHVRARSLAHRFGHTRRTVAVSGIKANNTF